MGEEKVPPMLPEGLGGVVWRDDDQWIAVTRDSTGLHAHVVDTNGAWRFGGALYDGYVFQEWGKAMVARAEKAEAALATANARAESYGARLVDAAEKLERAEAERTGMADVLELWKRQAREADDRAKKAEHEAGLAVALAQAAQEREAALVAKVAELQSESTARGHEIERIAKRLDQCKRLLAAYENGDAALDLADFRAVARGRTT